MTLVQAQQRYIDTVLANQYSPKVCRVAKMNLYKWAKVHGFDGGVIWMDAYDMVKLERNASANQ